MKPSLFVTALVLGCAGPLRAAGPSDLIRLYEEEILAHDLYVALAKIHPDIMPLRNIPRSEARHRESMASILKDEGIRIPKPSAGRRFVTDGLDRTFAKWLAEGTASEEAACRVGVRLEDHDIADLREARAEFPDHAGILSTLEAASENHLRAFHRNLEARGGTYQAEALTEADLRTILGGRNRRGAGPCGCGQGGNANLGRNGPRCQGNPSGNCQGPRGNGGGLRGRGQQGGRQLRWRGGR